MHVFKLTTNIILTLNIFLFEYLHCKFFNIHWSFSQLKKLNYLKGWREIEILIDGKRNLIVDIVYQFISLWSASLETCAEIDLNILILQDLCMSFTLYFIEFYNSLLNLLRKLNSIDAKLMKTSYLNTSSHFT